MSPYNNDFWTNLISTVKTISIPFHPLTIDFIGHMVKGEKVEFSHAVFDEIDSAF